MNYKEKKLKIWKAIPKMKKNYDNCWIAFFIGTIIIFLDALCMGNKTYFGDAYSYNNMANYFIDHGLFNFHIMNIEKTDRESLFAIRAYAWPLIIAILKKLSFQKEILYKLFYSLFIALGLAYALPEFVQNMIHKKVAWWAKIIPTLLTIFFWNGLIIYPLSDIPAVVTVSLALMILTKTEDNNGLLINCLKIFMCGFLCGVSYYIRSGCKYIFFIAILIICCYKFKKQYLKKMLFVFTLVVGLLVSMIPQIEINKSYNGIKSYEVPIFLTTNTLNESYYHGFQWLRYETNVSGIHPEVVMVATDKVLDNILAAEDIATTDVNLKIIIKLFLKYPLEFLGMYATKFANFMDPRYGTDIYVSNLNSRQYVHMVLNYLIWFITCLGIGVNLSNRENGENKYQWNNCVIFLKKNFLYIVAFVVPALIHLAGTHVEARYFYPIYLLIYSYLAMICPWGKLVEYIRKNAITIVIVGLAIFGCLNSIWNFTFERFNYAELLIEKDLSVEEKDLQSFLAENQGNLVLQHDVWKMEIDDKKHLSMQGYICAIDRNSNDNQLYVVFCSDNKQYMYKINLYDNPYMSGEEQYSKSKYSIEKELANLSNGDYQIGLLLVNNEDRNIVMTPYTVNIQ